MHHELRHSCLAVAMPQIHQAMRAMGQGDFKALCCVLQMLAQRLPLLNTLANCIFLIVLLWRQIDVFQRQVPLMVKLVTKQVATQMP